MTAPFLSVVVPCYNEEDGLAELHRRLGEVCAPYSDRGYEIVLVNDGSADRTWEVIERLSAADPRIVGLSLSRNFGHGVALTAGLEHCRGERVLIIDADLQDPPELLGAMMAHLDDGANVAYGKRVSRSGESLFKRASAAFFYRLLNRLSDVPMPTDTGDFRLIDRRVVDALLAMPETARYIRGMVAWVGFRQLAVPYEREARFAGRTHYTLEKMLRLALDALTGFSTRPLRLAFYLGCLMMLGSLGLLGYIVVAYLREDVVPGWSSLALLITCSQAGQWMFLGLIGEYIGRIFQESKQRPKYFLAKKVGGIS